MKTNAALLMLFLVILYIYKVSFDVLVFNVIYVYMIVSHLTVMLMKGRVYN